MPENRWIRSTPMRRVVSSAICVGVVALLAGCNDGSPGTTADPASDVRSDAQSLPEGFLMGFQGVPVGEGEQVDALHEAATRLWTARTTTDCETMYRYERASVQQENSLEDYIKWCENDQPFDWKSFELGDAYVHGSIGWVNVSQSVGMRRYPAIPPRDTVIWQPWMLEDDVWKPVAPESAGNLPQSPAVRNHDAEADLADRFIDSWKYRYERDWAKLYEMTSAATKAAFTEGQFVNANENLIFVNCRLEWVEVVGDLGRTCAFVQFKYNDPSLEKMQPKVTVTFDRWLIEDGKWVLNYAASNEQVEQEDQP